MLKWNKIWIRVGSMCVNRVCGGQILFFFLSRRSQGRQELLLSIGRSSILSASLALDDHQYRHPRPLLLTWYDRTPPPSRFPVAAEEEGFTISGAVEEEIRQASPPFSISLLETKSAKRNNTTGSPATSFLRRIFCTPAVNEISFRLPFSPVPGKLSSQPFLAYEEPRWQIIGPFLSLGY